MASFPTLTNTWRLGEAVADEFETHNAQLEGYLGTEHHGDGSHASVTADAVTTDALDVAGAEQQTGVVSVSITDHQNNYNPGGLSGARILRVTLDGARTFTGLQAQTPGMRLTLINVTPGVGYDLTLSHADTTNSRTENVFICPGFVNYTVRKGAAVDLWYDGVSSVWRLVAA